MNPAQLVVDAVFRQFGQSATWWPAGGGEAVAIRVISKRPDTVVSFGDTAILSPTAVFEVRVSEAPGIRTSDRLVVDELAYAIQSANRLDPDRLVWTLEAYALASEDPLPQPRPLPEPVTPPGLWDGSYSTPAETGLLAGQVVVLTGAGVLALARADTEATARVVGVVVQGAAAGHAAQWTIDRPVDRTDWSPVLENGAALLVPGTAYFLSAVLAGGIADTPPAAPGAWVVPVGRAVGPTVLHVALGQPVRL